MRGQSRNDAVLTNQTPNPMALDDELRALWVEVVDASPKGRKGLGAHAYRVNKAAQGTYTPRPSDFILAVQAGADAGRLALGFMLISQRILDATPDEPGCLATMAREVGEAVAAGAEWITAPSPATAHKLERETGEAMTQLIRVAREAKRSEDEREAQRRTAMHRLRPPATRRTPLGTMGVVK